MLRPALRFAAVGLTLAIAACGGGDDPEPARPETQEPKAAATTGATSGTTIELEEQNASGQTGTATLRRRKGGRFDVAIAMSPPSRFPGESQNAHIHDVTCAEYAAMTDFNEQLATVVDSLASLANGRSRTTVEQPLAKRATGRFSINVHEQEAPYTVVGCGDIPRR
jgi:hypothetical protein